MAFFSIKGVKVAGMSAAVPKKIINNSSHPFFDKDEMNKFIETTGVEQRRITETEVCTSDLCHNAAVKLLKDINWNPQDVGILIFISQTPDYTLPNTGPLLQNRLGLLTDSIAFDIPLGCSGFIYGASVIASIMKSSGIRKGLFMAGDTISKITSQQDKSAEPLFGDAGTATAFELSDASGNLSFDLGTDGSGFNSIMVKSGGTRFPVSPESFVTKEYDNGVFRNDCQLILEGMDVFSFGITQAPKTVQNLLEKTGKNIEDIDYFIFHQANMKMNKMIAKKLKIPDNKVPYSLKEYGNTSSATIPLTLVSQLNTSLINKKNLIFCGFGVGLSWGTMLIETAEIFCSDIIEYESSSI